MEKALKEEVDSMRASLTKHDQGLDALRTRVWDLEKVAQGSVTEAVTSAVDAKLGHIQTHIAALEAKTDPRSASSSSAPATLPTVVPRGGRGQTL